MSYVPMLAASNPTGDLFLLLALVLPAWLMASIDSPFLVPYLIVTWAVGPEVRRLNDYFGGEYQNITVLSLIPLGATAALLIPVVRHFRRIPVEIRKGISLVLAALAYGTLLGVAINGVAGVIEGLGKFLPFLVVPYAASRTYSESETDLRLRSLMIIALIVVCYAWYQFVTAPPWDMFWLVESRMTGSMGRPAALEFRAFSSLNDAGNFGVFMSGAAIIGFCHQKILRPLGLFGVLAFISGLLISQVRMSWGTMILGIVAFTAVAKTRNRFKSILGMVVLSGAIAILLPLLPGADKVSDRMETLVHLDNDSSADARLSLFSEFGATLSNPLGRGFGSTGMGAKLTNKDQMTQGLDNGYLDLFSTIGLPMTLIFILGAVLIGRETIRGKDNKPNIQSSSSPHPELALAMLCAYAGSLLFFNLTGGVAGFILWLTVSSPFGLRSNVVSAPDEVPKVERALKIRFARRFREKPSGSSRGDGGRLGIHDPTG